MANMTTSGSTGYPGVIDTRTALTDGAAGDLIVANHPNGLGAAVIAIETTLGVNPQGTVADVVTRLGVSQNTDGTIKSTVVTAGAGASVTYSSGVFAVSFSGDGPGLIQNCSVRIDTNAPVANQFRINLLQADGVSTPTTALPVRVSFRATTLSSGIYNLRTATTTTQLVITGGSTLGFSANELGRIYIGLVDNATVPELCAWNSKVTVASTTAGRCIQLWRPSEAELQSTTAEGGAGGADSAATLYSTIARTNVPFKILAYLDIQTGATAGNWSNTPNQIQLVGPQTRTTGDIIQRVGTATAVVRTGSTAGTFDGTIPQITEGDLYLWATMTSSNVVNPIAIDGDVVFADTAVSKLGLHVHRNSGADAIGASQNEVTVANQAETYHFHYLISTNTSGATGFYLIGGNSAGTLGMNAEASASLFGPPIVTYMDITEVCA